MRAFTRVWGRRVWQVRDDVALAADARSAVRLAAARLSPVAGKEVGARVRADGEVFSVFLRPGSSDSIVLSETFVGRHHLPPLPTADVRTVLDLGANIGLTMAHLAVLRPNAHVVGVELHPENAALARRNTARWRARCDVVEAAVWHSDERVRYDVPTAGQCGASVAPAGERTAEGLSLTTLLDRLGWDAVDFVKMDIEGAEWEVLGRNTEWAERVRSLKVEAHGGSVEDCARAVAALGFDVTAVDPARAAVSAVRR